MLRIKKVKNWGHDSSIQQMTGHGHPVCPVISFSNNYIKGERLYLDKRLSDSYTEVQSYVDDNEYWHNSKDDITYQVLYKDLIYYEKVIRECDDKILTWLIKYRHFMWT